MKKNNLINTLSSDQQYAIRRWFVFSFFLLSSAIIVIIILELPQLYALQSIKKENLTLVAQTESFARVMDQQNKLQQESQQYKEKQEVITKYEKELVKLIDNFSIITQLSSSICSIESLQIRANHIELVASCTQIQHVTDLLNQLIESKQFHNLALTSLQQTEQQPSFLFTIKGER
ncbi:MAG: hypothetical protein WCD44_00820 [Candidatus Babeliales bacterium]